MGDSRGPHKRSKLADSPKENPKYLQANDFSRNSTITQMRSFTLYIELFKLWSFYPLISSTLLVVFKSRS